MSEGVSRERSAKGPGLGFGGSFPFRVVSAFCRLVLTLFSPCFCLCPRNFGHFISEVSPGISTDLISVPEELAYLCKELRLVGHAWHTMGTRWQALATLWLCAEEVLSSSGHTDLSFLQIRKSTLPDNWKEWMNAKLMRTDTPVPAESFRKIFTSYLKGIQSIMLEWGGTVTTEIWCHSGRMGIVGLLLCLYWQSTYSGAGHDWDNNVKVVESIFNAIVTSNL